MKRKTISILLGVLLASLFLTSFVSAVQLRPMNQINHPGLTNKHVVQEDGPNHVGVSDYSSMLSQFSELCENDNQIRPMNQGLNILKFFVCSEESD